jgi:hypothetical protein
VWVAILLTPSSTPLPSSSKHTIRTLSQLCTRRLQRVGFPLRPVEVLVLEDSRALSRSKWRDLDSTLRRGEIRERVGGERARLHFPRLWACEQYRTVGDAASTSVNPQRGDREHRRQRSRSTNSGMARARTSQSHATRAVETVPHWNCRVRGAEADEM